MKKYIILFVVLIICFILAGVLLAPFVCSHFKDFYANTKYMKQLEEQAIAYLQSVEPFPGFDQNDWIMEKARSTEPNEAIDKQNSNEYIYPYSKVEMHFVNKRLTSEYGEIIVYFEMSDDLKMEIVKYNVIK